MTPGHDSHLDLSPELAAAVGRLIASMNPENIVLLSKLLDDVLQDTGFGHVAIVVNRGYVAFLRTEKSYKQASQRHRE